MQHLSLRALSVNIIAVGVRESSSSRELILSELNYSFLEGILSVSSFQIAVIHLDVG